MKPSAMKLSAADCLRRGWTNLAANWELVVIQWLQALVAVLLLGLSLSLPVVILGSDALLSGRSAGRVLEAVAARLGRLSPGVMMAGVAMLAVWLLSLLVHCWFQAGAYGVLTAADRQALPGPRRHRLLFRTFSLRDFSGWGGLYLWRYFRLLVFFWALAFPLGVAVLVWLITLGVGGQVWGKGAVVGIACGGVLPLGFLFLVAGLWSHVAQAALAREGSGVLAAARWGLAVLGRRLGAVAVLVLLVAVAAFVVALVFVPVSFVPAFVLDGAPRLRTLVHVVLFLLQGIPNALLAMVLASSLVALVRSEPRGADRVKSKLLPIVVLLVIAVLAGCSPKPHPRVTPKAPVPKAPPAAPAPQRPEPAPPKPAPREPVPPETPPVEAPYDEKEPLLTKVGLASDLDAVAFPCCEEPLQVAVETQEVAAGSSLKVEPAAASYQKGFYRLQVAALRDERQAQDLARRLERAAGQPGEAYFDAGIDLYRVRVGRYPTREAAEADLRRLSTMGVTGGFVVNEGGSVTEPALRLTQGATSAVYPGRWLSVAPAGNLSVRVNGKRYRGRMLVYLNDRGALNLINELPVEDYLRGVVPSEMGPELYNQLEALKAQAVAARTYTLRNLGEFAREGYDICATPRCQVYGGMQVEHPLSDRAIAETAGQVLLYKGELVDALYSSTCGGHTEDVHVIFPLKSEPYLKGVPCMESGMARIDGGLPPGAPFPAGLTRRLLPPAAGASPAAVLGARLEHLALLAGLPAPREQLTSLDRREVQRYIASTFDLALDARLFLVPEDVNYLLTNPPADWTEEDRRRAAYLIRSGLLSGSLDQPLSAEETERMLLAVAELLHVVRREEVSFFSVAGGKLAVRSGKEDKVYDVSAGAATFRRQGEDLYSAALALVPGDRLTLFWQDARLVALTQEIDLDGVAFDRSSPYSAWSRYRTDSQLATQVNTRFPGFQFSSFEVLERGESGRVGKIRIYDGQGKTVEVDGLAVRWTLDVPDTLFTAKRLAPKNQEPGWLFTGKGFGHGVGMCQVGAYGMAQRGHSYREILTHYYTGVELGRVRIRNRAGAAR